MKTLNEEWMAFLSKVYPDGTTEQQARQLRTAFMSGATVVLCSTFEASEKLGEAQAAEYMGRLFNEVQEFGEATVADGRARN